MTAKTLEILRARWAEAVLLTVMWAAILLLQEEMMRQWQQVSESASVASPQWAMFLLGMGLMSLLIVWHLLFLGFLKTAAMEGPTPREPVQLLMAGRPYLWRIFGFQVLIGVVLLAITFTFLTLFYRASGQTGTVQASPWLAELVSSAVTVLLVKAAFVVPAFIVVLDMTLFEAFTRMIAVPLVQMRALVKMVVVGMAAVTIIGIAVSFAPDKGALFYAASAVNYLAKSVNFLVLWTASAVWTAGVFLPPPAPEGDDIDE